MQTLTAFPLAQLSPGKKGVNLEDQPLEPTKVTKRVLLSVLQQLYDPIGVFVDQHKIGLKILHSKVCLACPGDTFNVPLFTISPELAHLITDTCNKRALSDQWLC